MKQTLYSRILLILSGMMLLVAAALTYAAAIRIFPLFSFAANDPTPPHTLLRPYVVPVLALTASVLLLGMLYRLFSGRTTALILICALLLPVGQYISKEYDAIGTRYLIPALIFALYPQAVLSVIRGLACQTCENKVLRIAHRIVAGLNLLLMLCASLLGCTDQILFYQLLILLLTPILPLTVCAQSALCCFAGHTPPYVSKTLTALALLLPLSAFLRPFSFEASLYLARIGLPLLLLLPPVIRLLLLLRKRARKRQNESH